MERLFFFFFFNIMYAFVRDCHSLIKNYYFKKFRKLYLYQRFEHKTLMISTDMFLKKELLQNA